MTICVIIPARLKSRRLFNKPLFKINNESIINLTIKKILKIYPKKNIFVATDSKLVAKSCGHLVNSTIISKKKFLNGTERSSHAVDKIKKNYSGFLIISCDMPFLNYKILKYLEEKYNKYYRKNLKTIFTIHSETNDKRDIENKNIAKIVIGNNDEILYFSRNIIPSNIQKLKGQKFLTHHGIVMMNRENLSIYKKLKNTKLQMSEDNEWLKFIENGLRIKSFLVKKINPEINTIKDVKKLIKVYK